MIVDLWLQCLQEAYLLHRGQRMGELRGTRIKRFDDRGLHPESIVWGKIEALHELDADLAELGADPVLFRIEAQREAEAMFRAEILESVA